MKILVTGCAGFIGSHVSEALLKRGDTVIGVDNLNGYYSIHIKLGNIDILRKYPNFSLRVEDIRDTEAISEEKPDRVIHLASMAGVRCS